MRKMTGRYELVCDAFFGYHGSIRFRQVLAGSQPAVWGNVWDREGRSGAFCGVKLYISRIDELLVPLSFENLMAGLSVV